jgi:hypothetical protein
LIPGIPSFSVIGLLDYHLICVVLHDLTNSCRGGMEEASMPVHQVDALCGKRSGTP